MRILLTNDDGIYADGLQALREVFEGTPGLEVYVVAPDRERSASSHAITLHKPLHVNEVTLTGAETPMWSVNGTPADCTKIGVTAIMESPPDLVISGINRGANLGTDVLYSGTVSAAIEGVILGIPSIAVSLATHKKPDFTFAARFVERMVDIFARRGVSQTTLLNINVPALAADEIAGVSITRLGRRRYEDHFVKRQDPRGRTYYWLAGDLNLADEDPAVDVGALAQNLVSVTPMHLNLTDEPMQEELRAWLPDLSRDLPQDHQGRA